MSWRRWPWPNRAALPLLLSVLRTFWLWPWLELIRRWLASPQTGPLLSLPLMMGLFLAGLTTARWVLRGTAPLTRARLVVVGAGLVVITALLWQQFYRSEYYLWQTGWIGALGLDMTHWNQAVPAPFLVLLAAAYLWQQGVRDGCRSLHHDEIWAAFAGGALLLALAAVAATAAADDLLAPVGSLVLPFFGAGMAALAFSGLQSVNGSAGDGTDEAPGPNRYWFVSVVSVVAGLLGLGLLLSVLITPDAAARLLQALSPVLAFLQSVLLYAAMITSYLIFLVLAPLIHWLQGRAQPITPGEGYELPDFQRQLQDLPGGHFTLPPAAGEGLRWAGGVILILIMGLIFALALQRFWREEDEHLEETREFMFSRELLQAQLSSLWRRWLGRRKGRSGPLLDPFLSLAGEETNRRAVRTIYQGLLAAAAERGISRLPGQTPGEYQQRLKELWPDGQEALGALTEGYLQARYSPDAPKNEEVERLRRAWEELSAALAGRNGAANRPGNGPAQEI